MINQDTDTPMDEYDVIAVGMGIGGLYALYRLRAQGLKVLGIEGASGVGGVWFHNRYPGARVDVDSLDYSYYFSPELYREWAWSERYAAQPELLSYLNHVADRFALRQHMQLGTSVVSSEWRPARRRWYVTTSTGAIYACRFLVMTTGNLTVGRQPQFAGLESFHGDWVQTSNWAEGTVDYVGKKVAVVGTGSTGVQTIPVVANEAEHLYVFQRTPHFSIPAHNGPLDEQLWNEIAADVTGEREYLMTRGSGSHIKRGAHPMAHYSAADRVEIMERQYELGGHGMQLMFTDQATDDAVNRQVADFVRGKIRERFKDMALAERLIPHDYPFGARRLCLDTNYYETYTRGNVSLVDVRSEPIEHITATGIQTADKHYEVDLIIFALGFNAFTAALKSASIRNGRGEELTDCWRRGPRTYLGFMAAGFPNLFLPTGPGSPSVRSNMTIGNEQAIDWIADAIKHMDDTGKDTIDPTIEAQEAWTEHVQECAGNSVRLKVNNYMVHVNADDQSRFFIPYNGGFNRYVLHTREIADDGYPGFVFG